MEEWWGSGWVAIRGEGQLGGCTQGSMHVVSLPGAVGSRCPLSGVAQQAKQVPAYADDPNQRDKGGWADAGKKEKLQMQLYNKEKRAMRELYDSVCGRMAFHGNRCLLENVIPGGSSLVFF